MADGRLLKLTGIGARRKVCSTVLRTSATVGECVDEAIHRATRSWVQLTAAMRRGSETRLEVARESRPFEINREMTPPPEIEQQNASRETKSE